MYFDINSRINENIIKYTADTLVKLYIIDGLVTIENPKPINAIINKHIVSILLFINQLRIE